MFFPKNGHSLYRGQAIIVGENKNGVMYIRHLIQFKYATRNDKWIIIINKRDSEWIALNIKGCNINRVFFFVFEKFRNHKK